MTQPSSTVQSAGFAFARKLRDRDFEKFLSRLGYKPGDDIFVALPDELATDVFERMFAQASAQVAFIALNWPSDPRGFVFMKAEPGARPGAEEISIGAGATIGMIYDSLRAQTDQFTIPNSWTHVRRLANA